MTTDIIYSDLECHKITQNKSTQTVTYVFWSYMVTPFTVTYVLWLYQGMTFPS